jgi:tetratricopeptide (TPR) repeat protein
VAGRTLRTARAAATDLLATATAGSAAARDAMLALAEAQRALGDPAARAVYARLVEAAAIDGLYDPHLLPAMRGLGFAALALQDYAAAETALADALQMQRMRHGLHDPGQIEYLAALVQLEMLAGNAARAAALQQRRLEIAQRHYPADDLRLAAIYDEVAEDYRRLAQPDGMYAAHRSRRLGLEQVWGADDARLLPALIAEARSGLLAARMAEPPQPWDQRPLVRARTLLKSLEADARAPVLVDIGNVHWLAGDTATAQRLYREALEATPTIGERLQQPEVILWPGFEPPPLDDSDGRLVLEFRVNPRGRAVDVQTRLLTPAGDASGLERAAAWKRVLARSYFRPSIVDRRARASGTVQLQDRFRPATSA